MTFREALKKIQTETKCNHVFELGVSCEDGYGGWASCSCAIMASKLLRRDGETEQKVTKDAG